MSTHGGNNKRTGGLRNPAGTESGDILRQQRHFNYYAVLLIVVTRRKFKALWRRRRTIYIQHELPVRPAQYSIFAKMALRIMMRAFKIVDVLAKCQQYGDITDLYMSQTYLSI